MTAPPRIDRLAVGRVGRAHGVRGEVSVLPLSQVAERYSAGSRLTDEDGATLTVRGARPHRGRLLVRFEGIEDRTAAEALAGAYLFVPVESSPPLGTGEFWPHQILGCEVLTAAGRPLGEVVEILRTPANDVWVARRGRDEVLVPALKDIVEGVDVPGRRVVVREVPGLTPAPPG